MKIKLLDALIAATAIVYQLTLVTRNVGDFNKINGLNLLDPFV
jgi:predicted nucleic acid-binding protein